MAKLTTTDRSSRKAFLFFGICAGGTTLQIEGLRNHELRIPTTPWGNDAWFLLDIPARIMLWRRPPKRWWCFMMLSCATGPGRSEIGPGDTKRPTGAQDIRAFKERICANDRSLRRTSVALHPWISTGREKAFGWRHDGRVKVARVQLVAPGLPSPRGPCELGYCWILPLFFRAYFS